MKRLRPALVLGLLAAGLGLQVHFFTAFPQPILFGDPAGYFGVGERFQDAVGRLWAGEDPRAVLDSVRGVLYLAAVGGLFAVLDALRPNDLGFFRLVLAGFNTLGMLGTFLLGRRLSGTFWGGALALCFAAIYPSFSVQTGRLYPDPVTGCLFVWAAVLYLEALASGRTRAMAAAGLVFGVALLVRSQVMNFFLLLLALTLGASVPWWLRRRKARRFILAFAIGCLPAALAWGAILTSVGKRDDVVQLGNATFRPLYPYGFWQFLETDGFIGPYRFKTEPFYKALEAEAQSDRELLRSRWRQIAFTVGYVGDRPWESLLLVLDNVYRLYDRPANDYKWDYPFSYPWQVGLQRILVVFALVGLALFVSEKPESAGIFLIPLALALLHGLVFPWPRYNLPAMLIVIGAAGAAISRLVAGVGRRPGQSFGGGLREHRLAAVTLGVALGFFLLARGLFDALPEAGRVLDHLGLLALLAAPFLLAAKLSRGKRWGNFCVGAVCAGLALVTTGHAVRSRLWHEVKTSLGASAFGVEQEIFLSQEAMATLGRASEAFVAFDLRVPRGDLSGLTLEVAGQSLSASLLTPTMPRLRESTATGGRDWRGYPQWWVLPLDPALLPKDAALPLTIRLRHHHGSVILLGGDRFSHQDRSYEGPSFGDWPHAVALKLEYDGDYRLPVTLPLGSLRTRSYVLGLDGSRSPLRSVHRIRLVTLGSNEGSLSWESAPVPAAPRVALGFSAYSGKRGRAEISANGVGAGSFPLGAGDDFDTEEGQYRLCYRAEPPRQEKAYGHYFLVGPVGSEGPVSFRLRFRTGMSLEPMFFVIDRRRDFEDTAAAFPRCALPQGLPLLDGAATILDATKNNYPEDTGRWRVAEVF